MKENNDDFIYFTNHPKWNKFPNLIIKNIEFNANKNLITFATNTGFRIYDSKTFTLHSTLDENQEIIGSLSKANVLYLSPIIVFLGDDNNKYYKCSQVTFWDDLTKRAIGIVDFHERIFNFFITQYMIFFCLWNKIYVFELATLKYIYKISRVDIDDNLISVKEKYTNENKIISFAYIPTIYEKENIINIVSYYIDEKFKITYCNKKGITTSFENIKKIYLEGEDKIIVVNDIGNKIHIYNINNNNLLYCIYMGNQKVNVNNFSLDDKEKFLLCLCGIDEINIFKLKNIDNKKYKCLCNNHSDKKLFFRRKSTNNTFIDGYLNRLFNDSTVPFIFEKIRHYADFYKCCFNKKRKDEIILVNNYGFAFKYKFNRIKEKEPLRLIQEEILFDEDEDDNEEAV